VSWIHIGLNLEYHAGKFWFRRLHQALQRAARSWRRSEMDQRLKNLTYAEVIDG
jgi:hypothetical protein